MHTDPKLAVQGREVGQQHEFALWAATYDELPNPLLVLEQRFLSALLPEIENKNALDVGCGTGRWLQRLNGLNPATLTGVDFSPEMVARAKRKLAHRATVVVSDATCLPLPSCSQDVVLASFLASYVPSMDVLARELRRVCRTSGRVYLSDIHPETAMACHWKRGFRSGDRQVEPAAYARTVSDVVRSLRNAGFKITCVVEPPFGDPELEIFSSAHKLDAFYAAAELPAIYVLEASPDEPHSTFAAGSRQAGTELSLRGARISLDGETSTVSDIEVFEGRLRTIGASERLRNGRVEPVSIHLNGYLLLPGLINAHDHLEFGLYPNLGRGPYRNSTEWARDIHKYERPVIVAQQSIPREVRLWWGALRNLLSGVTTVCHHNPLHPELLTCDYPVRVARRYGWAHSLAMDVLLKDKFASCDDAPFVVHAAEGIDQPSADEIFELDRLNVLDERTVLVHGLALNADGIALVNARGAAMVWCPSSNRHLFGRTHGVKTIASVRRVLLGSDSPLTAAGDLLDEIRFAHAEVGVPARELYRMIFENAPRAFRLHDGQGRLRSAAVADLIAVRDCGQSPADTLAALSSEDIELVIVGGRVQLASEQVYRRLPADLSSGLRPLAIESQLRWVRAPLARLFREVHKVAGSEVRLGGKRVRHVCSAWL